MGLLAVIAFTLLLSQDSCAASPNQPHQRLIRRAASGKEGKAAAVAATTPKPSSTSVAPAAAADPNFTPLTKQRYSWPYKGPNKIDTSIGNRGAQVGDNICNSVKGPANSSSLCITSHMNSIDDFCIWAPASPNSTIADTEGEETAWCTKAGYGTRLIPAGALSGVQFVKTPDYIAIAGYLDQTMVNIAQGDFGGELDPHGADNRGNPIGSLMYSTAFSNGTGSNSWQQVIEWHAFIGSNMFCQKACNPASPNAAALCQHRLDRLGCQTNVPLNYAQINGTFQSCQGDDQQAPGVFTTTVNGVAQTTLYGQPADGVQITSVPFTMTVPATSSCTTYTSAAIYTDALSLAPATANVAAGSVATAAPTAGTTATGASAAGTLPSASIKGDATVSYRAPTAVLLSGALAVLIAAALL